MPARYILGTHSTLLCTLLSRLLTSYALLCLLSPHPTLFSLTYLTLLALLSSPLTSSLHLPAVLSFLPGASKPLRLLGCCTAALAGWRKYMPEPYGLFHVELNEGEAEWGNMGLWTGEEGEGFESAAKRLALRVLERAGCKEGGNVLDVGHGTGDSLLLHLSHPSVPRPSLLAGITSLPVQHLRSQSRCALLKSPSGPTLHLYCGDAISRPSAFAPVLCGMHNEGKCRDHPLYWDSSFPEFDSVVSIDSAYHYDTREVFFRQAYRRLVPGGMLALGDVAFLLPPSVSSLQAVTRSLLAASMSIPAQNVISPESYARQLQKIGFVDVELEDITDQVFPGFARYLEGRKGADWRGFGRVIRAWMWSGARFVVVSGKKPGGVRRAVRAGIRMPVEDKEEDEKEE